MPMKYHPLMARTSWTSERLNQVEELCGGAGYTNCYGSRNKNRLNMKYPPSRLPNTGHLHRGYWATGKEASSQTSLFLTQKSLRMGFFLKHFIKIKNTLPTFSTFYQIECIYL